MNPQIIIEADRLEDRAWELASLMDIPRTEASLERIHLLILGSIYKSGVERNPQLMDRFPKEAFDKELKELEFATLQESLLALIFMIIGKAVKRTVI